MIIAPPKTPFETDKAGTLIYPVDNGEPLSNDTEHLKWITFVKNGLEDWFAEREDVFVAADLLWYPIEGRPDISKAPDVMVVLDHPAGERSSYMQWKEKNRPPNVVFEFLSKSNTSAEMMEKLDFYSDFGCDEFYIYDYQRGTFRAFARQSGGDSLTKVNHETGGTWSSPLLGVTFGLNEKGRLWIKRPDGKLMETQRQLARRAEAEAARANALAQKLREMGIDPDSI
jgi:Uma2 family endonuclease